MASLSRRFLAGIGIEDDKVDLIIEKHQEVLTEVKEERDSFKEKAEKLPAVEKELADLKAASDDSKENSYKVKYDALKEEFEAYKTDIESKATQTKKENAFKALLKDVGISEKRIEAVLKVSDLSKVEFDDEGKIKDEEKMKADLKEEWSDFITSTSSKGAETSNPPANNGKTTMTREQIRAISDPIARQKAMMENPEAVGLPTNSNNS